MTTRFAPSPTGFLHLGHAFSALTAWRAARTAGGRFLLRLEDIDPGRCRPEFYTAILDDLAWLGLDWDGAVRVQSHHLEAFRGALRSLDSHGLLYPCFCTRAEILREIGESAAAPHTPDGAPRYPGTCRRLSPAERDGRIAAGLPYALRLDMAAAVTCAGGDLSFHEAGEGVVPCAPDSFGDLVLARKDSPASYHLCVTHDDALQGVTLVTRGSDLKPATHVHRLLQALMGWPAPCYAHHRLLADKSGRRLSKRDGATTLRDLRARAFSPQEVRAMAGSPD